MRVRIINPNTTAEMTAAIGRAARAHAPADVTIEAVNPNEGPASIEGHYDGAIAVPGILDLVRAGDLAGADAHVIACFGDPGLWAAREASGRPVVGIAEAAFHAAIMTGGRFAVLGMLARQVPVIHYLMHEYGVAQACAGVRVIDVAVLDLDDPGSEASARARTAGIAARDEDGAVSLVLGCAGMVDFAHRLGTETGLKVIDGVAAAVHMASALARLGLATSKAGGYGYPRAKTYAGALARYAFSREGGA